MKILIAADGSPWTRRMLDFVVSHDEWLAAGHEYTVMHAVAQLPVHVEAMAAGGQPAVQRYYDDEHEKVFGPIREFFAQSGLGAHWLGRVGSAAEVIAQTASAEKFDLLIMGSRGHGALAGLLLGSVAGKVLALCETPLLLIR